MNGYLRLDRRRKRTSPHVNRAASAPAVQPDRRASTCQKSLADAVSARKGTPMIIEIPAPSEGGSSLPSASRGARSGAGAGLL